MASKNHGSHRTSRRRKHKEVVEVLATPANVTDILRAAGVNRHRARVATHNERWFTPRRAVQRMDGSLHYELFGEGYIAPRGAWRLRG